MLAVIFSRGFGMHDDHFLVIEPAQAWADGINYQGWFPGSSPFTQPDGHSLLYSGFHYLLFCFFNSLGFRDPQAKMLIIRLLHAFFSLITIWMGFKITERIAGKKEAGLVGLLLSLLWFMPMMNVRNLVEFVCIPFMVTGIWLLLKDQGKYNKAWDYLLSGLVLGLGFSVRFQTAMFIGGAGLALLIKGQWKNAFIFSAGILLSILPVQGILDYKIWHQPFAEFMEYVRYNIEAANNYITGPWYNYILLLSGILLPPISLFLLFGFFASWRKQLIIFLPTFIFLLFHSFFPNKQERFIFPIFPFIIILGVVGWNDFVEKSKYWQKHGLLLKRCWLVFWCINLFILVFITFSYSKKSRVEAMTYLSRYKNIDVLLLEDSNHSSAKMVPQYYLNQWVDVISVTDQGVTFDSPRPIIQNVEISKAKFVLFFENKNLQNRVLKIKQELPKLEYETTMDPGFLDKVMFWLNPVNLNQTIYIYRNAALVPEKIGKE
ncbi:MAG: glycosyltransferase family 39 protein [Bacteroidetes bacterium]|nr:glycosyltransferase family 39 protein [Bacteroidota bacterium]